MEFTYFWAKCKYFQLNFYTLEQNVDVSSGFSLLLSKLSLFPMEFHYFSAKCQYFHRNFTTFEPHVNISIGFSLFLNLSPPITRGPYHGGGAFHPWALAHIYYQCMSAQGIHEPKFAKSKEANRSMHVVSIFCFKKPGDKGAKWVERIVV